MNCLHWIAHIHARFSCSTFVPFCLCEVKCVPRLFVQASRLVAHAAEVKEQADAPPATQSGAEEYYEVCYCAQAAKFWVCTHSALGRS